MFLNITEQKQIEAAIKQKNEELLKINAELDSFVYSASHDLRAPIASLLGLVEVARLEKDNTSLDRLLDMQKRSLLKLDNFIHDIVSYSRNNRLEVQVEPVDFITLIEGIFEQLYFMDHLVQLDCRIIITPNLNFFSDSKRIAVILNNFISNAIKYADISKPNPFVEVRVDKSPDGVIISVQDNGDGIETEHLPKIFEMFYRATQKSSGSGIGLYIVHEITNKMKGSIKVESVKKVGSKFMVSLPNLKVELMSPVPSKKTALNP
jgi:signal transduction histidine kinase